MHKKVMTIENLVEITWTHKHYLDAEITYYR